MSKRLFDLFFSLIVVTVFLPFAIIIIMVLVATGSYLPFTVQERVGKNGKIFKLYKFTTMFRDAEKNGPQISKSYSDPRITGLGRFLRKSYLDEMPQLINVLRGDMSLVGPRPERPYFHKKFSKEVKDWNKRLKVLPGITGLAQIKNTRSPHDPKHKIKYDLEYIKKQTVLFDFTMILKTIFK